MIILVPVPQRSPVPELSGLRRQSQGCSIGSGARPRTGQVRITLGKPLLVVPGDDQLVRYSPATAGANSETAVPFLAKTQIMPAEEIIVTEGKIVSVLPGTMFRVELPNKHLVLAHISGKMRKRFIRLTVGDRVKIEMSPYDLEKARIVYRLG